eukprot:3850064-Ditylum_brightwellii.AAC.1
MHVMAHLMECVPICLNAHAMMFFMRCICKAAASSSTLSSLFGNYFVAAAVVVVVGIPVLFGQHQIPSMGLWWYFLASSC